MKARYKILIYPRPFKMKAQIRVVAPLCVLHNILGTFGEEEEVQKAATALAHKRGKDAEADDDEFVYNIT